MGQTIGEAMTHARDHDDERAPVAVGRVTHPRCDAEEHQPADRSTATAMGTDAPSAPATVDTETLRLRVHVLHQAQELG